MLNNIEISKELLSEVLNIKYSFKLEPIKEWNLTTLEWWQDEVYKEQMHFINIYELAHKCKEWALSKGYNIWSDCLGSTQIQDDIFETIYSISSTHKEVERVIKACEWLLGKIKE